MNKGNVYAPKELILTPKKKMLRKIKLDKYIWTATWNLISIHFFGQLGLSGLYGVSQFSWVAFLLWALNGVAETCDCHTLRKILTHHREHKSIVVIRVFSDDVHSAGGHRCHLRRRPIGLLEDILSFLDQTRQLRNLARHPWTVLVWWPGCGNCGRVVGLKVGVMLGKSQEGLSEGKWLGIRDKRLGTDLF